MRMIRAAEFRRMPWKNSGGETTELAISPPDAGLNAFDWRISMARVAVDGPFSAFPGVDRTLAALGGAGMILTVAERGSHSLGPDCEPFLFSGDAAVEATLIGGPVDDLNVMTRRDRCRHRLTRRRGGASFMLARRGNIVIVPRGGGVQIAFAKEIAALATGDALIAGDGDADEIAVMLENSDMDLFVADIWAIEARR